MPSKKRDWADYIIAELRKRKLIPPAPKPKVWEKSVLSMSKGTLIRQVTHEEDK